MIWLCTALFLVAITGLSWLGERTTAAAERVAHIAISRSGGKRSPTCPPPWWAPPVRVFFTLLGTPLIGALALFDMLKNRRSSLWVSIGGARGEIVALYYRRALTQGEAECALDFINELLADEWGAR